MSENQELEGGGGGGGGGETSRRSMTLTLPELLKETESVRACKNSQALVAKRAHDGAIEEYGRFKTPLIPKKKKVLEEDKFVEELEKIIQRDFFPDLEKLKAQNAYHNAVENNDIHMLRELYSKYSLGATPSLLDKSSRDTPVKFETPLAKTPSSVASTPTHLPMEERPLPTDDDDDAKSITSTTSSAKRASMSLNTFLGKYTSEDNQSFQEILANSDNKHRIKYAWLYDKEKEHLDKFTASAALPSIEEQANYQKPLDIDTWTYKNHNYIMYTPSGAPLTAEEQVQLAKKQTMVLHKNTRFAAAPFKDDSVAGGSKVTTIKKPSTKIGVDGKEVENDTPEVNGFSFVRTPSPTPGVEESPFLTWGEIEGTPFRLDGSDTPMPVHSTKPYRMLETTKREKIAMQLSEKVSERYRDRKLKAIQAATSNLASTPRPRSTLERLSTMSPAARKLVGNKIGSSRDKMLSASYTPKIHTPKVLTPSIRSTSSTPARSLPPTPGRSFPTSSTSSATTKKRAADYF